MEPTVTTTTSTNYSTTTLPLPRTRHPMMEEVVPVVTEVVKTVGVRMVSTSSSSSPCFVIHTIYTPTMRWTLCDPSAYEYLLPPSPQDQPRNEEVSRSFVFVCLVSMCRV